MRELPLVVTFRVSEMEYRALKALAERLNVTVHQLLHGVLIDVLVEEGYDALRCEQSEGCEGSGEASETCGAATP
jgi:hypothetical protein